MRIPHSALPKIRLIVLAVFVVACTAFFGYLWVNAGGQIPGLTNRAYSTSIDIPKVDNLVQDSDIMIAGVKVGKVRDIKPTTHGVHVVMDLDPQATPLHQGATVRVRNKTLVEETYLEITDGKGAPLPNGTSLSQQAARPSVQLNDVLASLDPQTRESLGATIRSLGAATDGRGQDISRTMTGLGEVGRQGHDALDALAAQSADLQRLVPQTTQLLQGLDTRQGQIASLVSDANRLTQATSDDHKDLRAAVRELPGVTDRANAASRKIPQLSQALQPVAKNLNTAAPALSSGLQQLPPTARDLRGLMPALNGTLNAAPNTLGRVPPVAADARDLIPRAKVTLSDLNPALGYLKPYGRDIAAFFTNVSSQFAQHDVNGHYMRVFMIFNEQSVRDSPLNLNKGLLNKSNAYPAPGQSANPGPFVGQYQRLQRGPH